MSILRYIDDLCLDTKAALFYSVRTQRDIIFEPELERLEECLPNFQRTIVLTRPESGWTGLTGHLSREFISLRLGEVGSQTFFMCGPEAFMDHVKGILLSSGVDERRIIQERFGGRRAAALAPSCLIPTLYSLVSISSVSFGDTMFFWAARLPPPFDLLGSGSSSNNCSATRVLCSS